MTVFACEKPSTGVAADMAAAIAVNVPVLRVEGLTLRAPIVTDFPAYADIACSDRGSGIGGPMTRDDAWRDFIQLASGWMLHGHGGWTVEDDTTGDVAGFVCIGLEPGDLEPELGYLVTQAFEGSGIAYKAGSAARDWARSTLKLKTLVSYIDPSNTRSIALAKRLRAQADGEIAYEGDTVLVYRYILDGGH